MTNAQAIVTSLRATESVRARRKLLVQAYTERTKLISSIHDRLLQKEGQGGTGFLDAPAQLTSDELSVLLNPTKSL